MFFETYNEADIIEATSNATMAKLNYEFDMMLMEHRQNLADIELNAVLEYCTDDDITQMYYKEAEEIQQKSKGIFRRIIDAIKALFKKIKEFIFGSKKEEPDDPNAKITLPEDPEALEKETRSALSSIKEFLSGKKDDMKKSALTGAVSGAASVVSSKATEWLVNKAGSLADEVQNTLDNAAKQMETKNMTPEQQNEGRGLLNWLQKCGTRIMNCAKKIAGSNKGTTSSNDQKPINQKSSPDSSNTPDNNEENKSAEGQIQVLTRENNRIKFALSELEAKLSGDNKNDSWKDRRQIETLHRISSIPENERSPKEQAKFEELSKSRGIQGDERQKYIDAINDLKIRMKANDDKIEALRKGQRKSEKRAAKENTRNVKKGNISTDDLLKNANKLI